MIPVPLEVQGFLYKGNGCQSSTNLMSYQPPELLAEAVNALLLHRKSPQLAEMVAEQSEVLEGYGAFLAEYASQRDESASGEVPGFAFTYLDGDDVPELIVIDGYAHSCGAAVYTFEKGEVISVGAYGQYGAMGYREKEGIVFDDYDTGGNLQSALTEELENLLLTQEEALKQNVLIAAGAQESDILLLDYDDYDRDGKCEAFIICGDSYDEYGEEKYREELYFAGADCCTLLREIDLLALLGNLLENALHGCQESGKENKIFNQICQNHFFKWFFVIVMKMRCLYL